MENLYQLFDVGCDAEAGLIRQRFQQKMLQANCERMRARLLDAIVVLLDVDKRRMYDTELVGHYLARQRFALAEATLEGTEGQVVSSPYIPLTQGSGIEAYNHPVRTMGAVSQSSGVSAMSEGFESSNQRQFTRLSFDETFLVNSQVEVQCLDISRGGLLMASDPSFEPSQMLQLQSDLLSADGEVRFVREEDGRVLAGIAFNQVEFYSHLFIKTQV